MSVQDVQRRLVELGYPIDVDGRYGDITEAAILDVLSGRSAGLVTSVTAQPRAERPINEIIVHCTATPAGRNVTVDTIRQWHRDRGWDDIGYHHVILLDGTVMPGRPEARIGAHCQGHNAGTIGVVYVGGLDADALTPRDTRTPAQRAALLATVKALVAKYPAIRKVTGHNQYAAKACPSFDVSKDPLGRQILGDPK